MSRKLMSSLALALGAFFLVPCVSQAADMRGLVYEIYGKDALVRVVREQVNGRWKKTTTRSSDSFSVYITFDPGGTSTSGTFAITDYETFPVTGTWSSPSDRSTVVKLSVDQSALHDGLDPQICGGSCTLSASWKTFNMTVNKTTHAAKLTWKEILLATYGDASYEKHTYTFKGAGGVVIIPPSSKPGGGHHAAH